MVVHFGTFCGVVMYGYLFPWPPICSSTTHPPGRIPEVLFPAVNGLVPNPSDGSYASKEFSLQFVARYNTGSISAGEGSAVKLLAVGRLLHRRVGAECRPQAQQECTMGWSMQSR